VDSRPTEDGTSIRRRRECINCGKRFTTYEKIEEIPIMVIKKDGTREPFDSEKILSGVRKACEKRPVSTADMELLVDNVVREVFNSLEQEVRSEAIGEMVMSRLKDLDEVAYVRFASVYRQFKDINTFMNELKILLGEN
jgi:transcriptional repressor NrdR